MNLHDRAIQRYRFNPNANNPRALQLREYSVQYAVARPAVHARVDRVPAAETGRRTTPFTSVLGNIKDCVEQPVNRFISGHRRRGFSASSARRARSPRRWRDARPTSAARVRSFRSRSCSTSACRPRRYRISRASMRSSPRRAAASTPSSWSAISSAARPAPPSALWRGVPSVGQACARRASPSRLRPRRITCRGGLSVRGTTSLVRIVGRVFRRRLPLPVRSSRDAGACGSAADCLPQCPVNEFVSSSAVPGWLPP